MMTQIEPPSFDSDDYLCINDVHLMSLFSWIYRSPDGWWPSRYGNTIRVVWKWDLASNTTQNLSVEGHWCKPITESEKLVVEACKLQSTERVVPRSTSWIMSWCREEVTHCRRALMNPSSMTRNRANDFWRWKWSDDTGFRVVVMKEWSVKVLQWMRHKMGWWILWSTSLGHIGDNWNGLVELTPKMDGAMDQWWYEQWTE